MSYLKKLFHNIKARHLCVLGVILLISLAAVLLWYNKSTSTQASGSTVAQVYFDGRYRIAGGEWQTIKSGEHIPATRGDVSLQLNFHLMDPDGNPLEDFKGAVPIAFFTDHIGLTFFENGKKTRVTDNENPLIGEPACAESWTMQTVKIGNAEPVEVLVHNPHVFGNETAIDEMLSSFSIWANMDFEKEILNSVQTERNAGILLMLASVVFLGIALFSSLIHVKNAKIIWLFGLVALFAGVYLTYSRDGVSFFSESMIANTTILGSSMMLYMLFLSMIICSLFKASGGVGRIVIIVLSSVNALFFLVPIITEVYFYDTWVVWCGVQTLANIILAILLIKELILAKKRERLIYIGALLPLIAFVLDAFGTWVGAWKGGVVSLYVFALLLAVATVMVLRLIPRSINATTKARELELEKITLNAALAQSRISTMMSQIRPHFIYNTLGSIEQLCKLDPPKAADLVHNFSKYLRGNFGELDNPKPILMSQEMEHVHHYISIENVRFPDMTFTFEMNSVDFKIPALTVQPIVENAIKHGLMKLPKGGTIRVISYDTDTEHCISVVDDGVGFDIGKLQDDRQHVGLRNIRERLKVMVNGTMSIESTVGVGTSVLIRIPKEDRE